MKTKILIVTFLSAVSFLILVSQFSRPVLAGYCGDRRCDPGEDCVNCWSDCDCPASPPPVNNCTICGPASASCPLGNLECCAPGCTINCCDASGRVCNDLGCPLIQCPPISNCPTSFNNIPCAPGVDVPAGCRCVDVCGASGPVNNVTPNCSNGICGFNCSSCESGPSTPLPTATAPPVSPSCTGVSFSPTSVTVEKGESRQITATPTGVQNGTVAWLIFSSLNTGIATVNPGLDTTSPYQTYVVGVSGGSTTAKADVYLNPGGLLKCSGNLPVTVNIGAWLQTAGGDVHGNSDVGTTLP